MRIHIINFLVFMTLASLPLYATAQEAANLPEKTKAAEAGDVDAQLKIGLFYLNDSSGYKDPKKARQWLLKAAEGGNAEAQKQVAALFHMGKGGERSIDKAVHWYEKAVAQHHHGAEYNLGLLLEIGRHVKQDIPRAIELYTRASRHPTYVWPQFRLGRIYELGLGGKKNLQTAAQWYHKAANRGDARSQFLLARILEGNAKNFKQLENAREWYKLAASGGVENAKKGVERVENALKLVRKKLVAKAYPPAGPTITYKGRTLIGSTYPNADNEQFFKWMKWAINKVDDLPKKLKRYPDLIREIRYDPPSKQRRNNDAYTNIIGVYTVGPDDSFPAPIIIYKDVKWGSPLQFAYSLAGNGLRAERHKRRLEIKSRLMRHDKGEAPLSAKEVKTLRREHAELLASLKKSDQEIVDQYECAPMLYQFELMKVWEESSKLRDAQARRISERKCW